MTEPVFDTEADLVAAFAKDVERYNTSRYHGGHIWQCYHETSGWDLLLVADCGIQVGIEAKLKLNAKVLEQALPRYNGYNGPDYRAVLVPREGLQNHLIKLAGFVGITIITGHKSDYTAPHFQPGLPSESGMFEIRDWHPWCPAKRCPVPAYVPDVCDGKAAPLTLTTWKIRAIKLMIVLERRGYVTRADMQALELSASRWTDRYHGFLSPGPAGGYVRNETTPDFKAQHPRNWAEIAADFETWSAVLPAELPLAIAD